MKVAVIHFGKSPDLDKNERNLLDLNIEAAKNGADLIVNPELPILPLFSDSAPIKINSKAQNIAESRAYARWFAEVWSPRLIQHLFDEVVVPHGKYIVISVITSDPEFHIFHNAALLIGPKTVEAPEGIYQIYYKRELHGDIYATKGASKLEPARLDIGNIGAIICGDYSTPLISRSLAINGSDIIAIPAAITSPTSDTLKVRALENGIPFALANCYEHDGVYVGEWKPESAIVRADGTVTDSYSGYEDTILYDDFDLSAEEAKRCKTDKLNRRRPHLYQGAVVDLTSRILRDPCSLPPKSDICVITVSGVAVEQNTVFTEGRDLIASVSKEDTPVFVVLPELSLERKEVQKFMDFMKEQKVYAVCSFVENLQRVVALFDPHGQELLSYKKVHLSDDDVHNGFLPGDRLEFYFDLPVGRIGVLAGEDLLYPEAIEAHRNVAVDLILASSRLNIDGGILFADIAKSRHLNVAVADWRFKGGIYKRAPNSCAANEQSINSLKFDTQEGRIEPARGLAQSPLVGLESIVRIVPRGAAEHPIKEDAH